VPEIQASGGRCHGTIQRDVQEHAEEGTATNQHFPLHHVFGIIPSPQQLSARNTDAIPMNTDIIIYFFNVPTHAHTHYIYFKKH